MPVIIELVMFPLIVEERVLLIGPAPLLLVLDIEEDVVELIGTAVVTMEVTVLVVRDPGPADAVAVVVNVVGLVIGVPETVVVISEVRVVTDPGPAEGVNVVVYVVVDGTTLPGTVVVMKEVRVSVVTDPGPAGRV